MESQTLDDVLAHYGVKGMRWGVRKRVSDTPSGPADVRVKAKPGEQIRTAGGTGHPASADAVMAAIARQKARKSGPQALSNQEMRHLVDRMNLESQYAKLDGGTKSAGKKFVDDLLSGPQAQIGLEVAKFGLRNNDDPRVKIGLQVADQIVKSRKKK